LGQTGWIRRVRCGKFNCKFFVPKVAKTALQGEFCDVCTIENRNYERNKHQSWVKRGGLGAFVVENSTERFFVPKVAKTALQGELCDICTVENRNSENATNMSLGSNGVDSVRSLRKIQLRVFLFQKLLKRPSRASFVTFVSSKTETPKMQQT
jgi:hypothetical protein